MELTANPPRRRWRPKALPTLATIVAIAIFVAAGEWQRGRMEQKQALRSQFDSAYQASPVPLPAASEDWSVWRYRAVVATGVFDAQRQILLDNKVHRGRIGFHVVTPLLLNDGRAVLIDRGFVAGTGTRAALPSAPPPIGIVTVHGRVNIPPPAIWNWRVCRTQGRFGRTSTQCAFPRRRVYPYCRLSSSSQPMSVQPIR